MLKKLLSTFLAFVILTVASSANVFARAGDDEKTSVTNQEKQTEKTDLASALKSKSDSINSRFTKKDTLAEYEKTKAQGKKFSTTTKVLIGVGIAAVVIGVVVIAASKGAEDAASF
jgi:Flp pilus assembly protein TadB